MFHVKNDDNLLSSNQNVLDSRIFQNRFAELYFSLKLGEKENKSTIVPKLGVKKNNPLFYEVLFSSLGAIKTMIACS